MRRKGHREEEGKDFNEPEQSKADDKKLSTSLLHTLKTSSFLYVAVNSRAKITRNSREVVNL